LEGTRQEKEGKGDKEIPLHENVFTVWGILHFCLSMHTYL